MNIVVTDGHTLNPGDLSWAALEKLGRLTIYERTAVPDIVERCREANIILTNKVPLSAGTLSQLPHLQLIGVTATGYNIIDTAAAKQQGITVCNVPAYGTASVAQHTFALLLELTNQTGLHASSVAAGEWVQSKDFSYTKSPITELAGKTIGLVGLGNIAQQTARIAQAFDMRVVYYTPGKKQHPFAEWMPLPDLFAQSDVVSLHCPLTNSNAGFVNNSLLSTMKPTAVLINTARGQLINEAHLAAALNDHRIAGAALDVLSAEPPPAGNPLLTARNCIITPHIAWISLEARQRVMATTVANIEAFLNKQPQHVVGQS